MKSDIAALILAAGKSTRMGTTKSLLMWHGDFLVNYQINSLIKSGCKEIYLVIGHNGERIRSKVSNSKVKIINNPDYDSGKSSSIIKGIKSLDIGIENLIIVGVDQPRPIWFYKKIIKFHNKYSSVISSPINNKKRGHPLIFRKSFFNEILKISNYKNGLKDLFRRNDDLVKTFEINSEWTHLDLNDKESFERSLKLNLEDE
ncbi:MAG: nucleotidyltransferase family protein [Dehalococcoidia bacterium]|nr:nucleotidyltransferase family protein [Dehalococcoidia bacterium]